MGESGHNDDEPTDKELAGKKVAFYSVLLSARVQSNMERDKALLSLSSVAIGLLVTLLNTGSVEDWFRLVPYVGAFFCFGICIFFLLKVFKLNADYIDNEITNKGDNSKLNLSGYDRLVSRSFLLGVFFSRVIGLNAGIAAIASNERGIVVGERAAAARTARESVQGLSDPRPVAPSTAPGRARGGAMSAEKKVSEAETQRSLSGLANLKPEKTPSQNQTGSQPSGKDEGKK